MYRISKQQCKENQLLSLIDDFIYAGDAVVEGDTIYFSKDNQRTLISENFTNFADITAIMEDMKRIEMVTVRVKDDVTGREKEVNIEIEGGI